MIVKDARMNQIIGSRVRELRERRGLTQGQLAYKADTTSSQISRLENNERPGAQAVLLGRIASILGTSIDYLLGNTDDPMPPLQVTPDDSQPDPDLQRIADNLIALWREVRKLDPDTAERLTGIAILQGEMVLAAARSAAKRKEKEEESTSA